MSDDCTLRRDSLQPLKPVANQTKNIFTCAKKAVSELKLQCLLCMLRQAICVTKLQFQLEETDGRMHVYSRMTIYCHAEKRTSTVPAQFHVVGGF